MASNPSTEAPKSMAPAPSGVHTTSASAGEEPSNKGMEAKDWPRGPSDPAVAGTSETGSAPDTSQRGHGAEGQQYAQPDQSGVDLKVDRPNPGYEMLKEREKAEKEAAAKKA